MVSGQAVLKSEYNDLLVIFMQLIQDITKTLHHHLWDLAQLEQQQAVQSLKRQKIKA